jgi:hypothetical protein
LADEFVYAAALGWLLMSGAQPSRAPAPAGRQASETTRAPI